MIDAWRRDRKALFVRRRALEHDKRAYADRLATHLYSFPMSDPETFDGKVLRRADFERMMEGEIEDCTQRYQASRDAARAAGIETYLFPQTEQPLSWMLPGIVQARMLHAGRRLRKWRRW